MKVRRTRLQRAAERKPIRDDDRKVASDAASGVPSAAIISRDVDHASWLTNQLLLRHCMIGKYFDQAVNIVVDALTQDGLQIGYEIAHYFKIPFPKIC